MLNKNLIIKGIKKAMQLEGEKQFNTIDDGNDISQVL